MVKTLACDNSRFSSLFAAEDVSRNVPSGEERGETVVFAGYQNPCVLENPWLLRHRAHRFGEACATFLGLSVLP